jgi:phage shock protein PspC (stress-responsive transcriptional regulator)
MAKLTLSNNKVIAGVCGGLAEHFGLNTSAVRIVFILLLFITFSSIGIAYVILWAIMPKKNSGNNYQERMHNRLKR